MAQEVNLFDPFGIAKAVRGQVNQVAIQSRLPQLPDVPTVKVSMGGFPFLNRFDKIPNRPGMARGERAG